MILYEIMDLKEEIEEIIGIIEPKLDDSTKEVYIINSILGEKEKTIIKDNILFRFVQFLPKQNSYMNIENETDGYITRELELGVINYYCYEYYEKLYILSNQRVYYKQI